MTLATRKLPLATVGFRDAQVVARSVERDAQLVGVAANLSEQKTALKAGHRGADEAGY